MTDVPPPPPEEPISKVVNIIIDGSPERTSQTFWKVEARRIPLEEPCNKRLNRDEIINFYEANVAPNQTSHFDVLVITIIITSIEIRRVYMDTGATVNVRYLSYFKKMAMEPSNLRLCAHPQSFMQEEIQPESMIQLPSKIGPYPWQRTTMLSFYAVDFPSAYNVILDRD